MQIKGIEKTNLKDLEDEVNTFIKDKEIISIDYEVYNRDNSYTYYSALIQYED